MATGITKYSEWLNQNPDAVNGMVGGFAQPTVPVAAANTSQYDQLDEMLKSQAPTTPQTPKPVEAPQLPVVGPVVAPTTKNPKSALQELSNQDVAGQNQVTESINREGSAKVDSAKKRAGVMKGASVKSKRYVEAAEKEVDDNKILKDEAENWLTEDMRKLREPPVEKTGWQKAVTALTGVLGMALQGYLGPVGGGLAYGLQAIDDHVNENVRKQLEEQAKAEASSGKVTDYLEHLDKDSANELDMGSKLVANHYLATSHVLEQMAEESKVPELQEGYRRFALESQEKGRNILRGNYQQQIADSRAAANARAAAANKAAELERQRVKDAVEAGKTLAETDKLRAEADKARNEGGAYTDPEGSAVVSTGRRTDQQQTEFDKRASAYDGLRPHLMNLSSMANKSGKEAKAIFSSSADAAGALLSVARGQGQQSESEKKASWTGLVSPATWDAWDTYSDEERQNIANEAIRVIEDEVSGSLATYRGTIPQERRLSRPKGWQPREVGPASQPVESAASPAQATTNEVVKMINRETGKVINVPVDRVPAARNSGFMLPEELTQEEANAPMAADEVEAARINSVLAQAGG